MFAYCGWQYPPVASGVGSREGDAFKCVAVAGSCPAGWALDYGTLKQKITVAEVVRYAGLSTSRLQQLFHAKYNCSVAGLG